MLLSLVARRRVSVTTFIRIITTRMRNLFSYGSNSPFPHYRAWCCPKCITKINPKFNKSDSGRVEFGDWDLDADNIKSKDRSNQTYNKVMTRLHEEVEFWQDSQTFNLERERLLAKGISIEAIINRYESLDQLRLYVKFTGQIPKSKQGCGPFEFNGIPVNIDRSGKAISAGGGMHRLALAQYFNVSKIPVEIYVVHAQSLPLYNWKSVIQIPCTCHFDKTIIT